MTAEQSLHDLGTVGIIGGNGRMGRWFGDLFRARGIEVVVSDIGAGPVFTALVKQVATILIAVPIGVTPEVIDQVAPHLGPEQLLADLTSVKQRPLESMLRSRAEVLGLHPMFGADVADPHGQIVIACPGRPGPRSAALQSLLVAAGFDIVEMEAAAHDRMMAVVQGLNHFHAIVFAHALRELDVSIGDTMRVASPVYAIRMQMMARILAQDPRLYAEIETHNPEIPGVLDVFMKSAERLRTLIEKRDVAGFVDYFSEAAAHLGENKQSALSGSSELIEAFSALRRR